MSRCRNAAASELVPRYRAPKIKKSGGNTARRSIISTTRSLYGECRCRNVDSVPVRKINKRSGKSIGYRSHRYVSPYRLDHPLVPTARKGQRLVIRSLLTLENVDRSAVFLHHHKSVEGRSLDTGYVRSSSEYLNLCFDR